MRDFGVFLFEINGIFHYEDFERKPSLFGYAMKPSRKQPPYVKLEGAFPASDIKSITMVSKAKATQCVQGLIKQEGISPAGKLARIFQSLATRVVLQDGTTYFFELINRNQFINTVKEITHGSVQSV